MERGNSRASARRIATNNNNNNSKKNENNIKVISASGCYKFLSTGISFGILPRESFFRDSPEILGVKN
jgi:hypothetical protein